ncbi:MAG: internal scaffolding protein [Microvirus sp.]|nr:MAG: internal scaffolding protein [Microvirus sp.]
MKTEVRALYGYDPDVVSNESGLLCKDKSLTVQEQRDEADINKIWDRYTRTGQLPELRVPPSYGDFDSEVRDYQSALELVRAADESFMALPAGARSFFENNPANFVAFMEDPANLDKLKELGVKVPSEPVKPEA